MKCKHEEIVWDSNEEHFYCLNCGRTITGYVSKIFGQPKIILHLGLHKTGTTFLQKEVFPKILDANLIINKYQVCQLFLEKGRTNIISGEGFSLSMAHWGYTEKERYATLDNLKKLYPTAKIIVGTRFRTTWLKSCYSQYIRTGGTLPFNEYRRAYFFDSINMQQYVAEVKKRWKSVYIYRQETLKEDVPGMLKFIGVNLKKRGQLELLNTINYNRKQNVSLSMRQINLVRRLNAIHPMVARHIEIAIGFVRRRSK